MRLPVLLMLAAATAAIGAGEPAALRREIAVPTVDGRVAWGELCAALVEASGIDGTALRRALPETVPVEGALAKLQFWALAQATGQAITARAADQRLVLSLDRQRLRRERDRVRAGVRGLVERLAPEQAALAQARYGLHVHGDAGALPLAQAGALPARLVVLVHGLDESGTCWSALVPALRADGHGVAELRYANDQPVARSAALLAQELSALRTRGVARVDLVAHSMGGLVCREVLTAPAHYAGAGAGGDRFPAVGRLIMVGTPNHGSPMAAFHPGAEACEQLTRTLSGDGLLFGAFLDGCGEAQEDLTPGSPFLTALNARPHPQGVALTVIAGSSSPVGAAGIAASTAWLRERAPLLRPRLEEFAAALAEVADGVGDGCVAVASTRLPGVDDHVVVAADHVALLGPWINGLPAPAPAVAEIRKRLK